MAFTQDDHPLHTFQVARILRVPCSVVRRWMDRPHGRLASDRTADDPPQRKISKRALLAFLREHGFPRDMIREAEAL